MFKSLYRYMYTSYIDENKSKAIDILHTTKLLQTWAQTKIAAVTDAVKPLPCVSFLQYEKKLVAKQCIACCISSSWIHPDEKWMYLMGIYSKLLDNFIFQAIHRSYPSANLHKYSRWSSLKGTSVKSDHTNNRNIPVITLTVSPLGHIYDIRHK